MISDNERREVARRLREYDYEEARELLVDCADWGERVINMLDCGDTEGECYAALADLIEPTCDREELLELAKEMEEFGTLPVKHPGIRVLHNDDFSRDLGYARRIREALGVAR